LKICACIAGYPHPAALIPTGAVEEVGMHKEDIASLSRAFNHWQVGTGFSGEFTSLIRYKSIWLDNSQHA